MLPTNQPREPAAPAPAPLRRALAPRLTRRVSVVAESPRLAFLTVFCSGFLPLLTLSLTGRWSAKPGLFDYSSATLGDGLLLPVLAASLASARGRLAPARHEGGPVLIAAAVAGASAVGIQWSWHADSNPHTNWTLPRPHDFTVPGWWHAAFFVLAAVFLTGMVVSVAARLAGAARAVRRREATTGWLAVTLFCGLGYIGLASVDDLAASQTGAGRASAAGVSLGLALSAAFFASLGRELRSGARALLLGGSGAVGLALLVHFSLPVPVISVASAVGLVVVLALVAGLAAELIIERGVKLIRPGSLAEVGSATGTGRLVATTLLLGGVLALALARAPQAANESALALIAAAVLAVVINPLPDAQIGDQFLLVVACAYTSGLLVLAYWLDHDRTSFAANYALGFSSFFVDGLVVGLIRTRFQEVIEADRREAGRGSDGPESVGEMVMLQVFGLGGAAVVGLLVLYATAAPILGLDRATASFRAPESIWILVGLGAASLLLAAGALISAGRRLRRLPAIDLDAKISVGATPAAFGLAALVVSLLGLLTLDPGRDSVYEPLGLVAGAALAILTVEDVASTGARLHLRDLDGWGKALTGLCALTIGVMQWWVITSGLWAAGGRPVKTIAAVATAFALPLLITIIAVLALGPVGGALGREQRLTPQKTFGNLILTRVLYSFLGFLAFTIPVFAVGRLRLLSPPDAGLVAISSLAVMPSLIGAFLWVVSNNVIHLRGQRDQLPIGLEPLAAIDPAEAARQNERRLDRLAWHTRFQNAAATVIFAAGATWLAWQLLR